MEAMSLEAVFGERIHRVTGIVNGTTNYILSKMAHDKIDFNVALKQAQKVGCRTYSSCSPEIFSGQDGFIDGHAGKEFCGYTRATRRLTRRDRYRAIVNATAPATASAPPMIERTPGRSPSTL